MTDLLQIAQAGTCPLFARLLHRDDSCSVTCERISVTFQRGAEGL
jgi:hypothetical protein